MNCKKNYDCYIYIYKKQIIKNKNIKYKIKMKNQSEVKFTLQILRLHKIESKDLNEKQQKFFQDNLEQSL